MTDTIAAGEIREQQSIFRPERKVITIYPLDNAVFKVVVADGMIRTPGDFFMPPQAARDFARAILAAADWAERQGG